MTDRLEKIFSALPKCKIFADIGCDHGYVAKAMLDFGKCERVVAADVSAKCLEKAAKLLADYVAAGRAELVVADGFCGLPDVDLALIAGMGGEEIVKILCSAKELPTTLVLQPMKNCDKVRERLLEKGYRFLSDRVFFSSKKYYNLIVVEKGEDALTEREIEFGRDNLRLKPQAFTDMINKEISANMRYLKNERLTDAARAEITKRIDRLKCIL